MKDREKDPWVYIEHIQHELELLLEFSEQKDASAAMRFHAVCRCLEVVGEAARNLPQGFRDAHPEVPWRGMIALRNVLIHEYVNVAEERIWAMVRDDVPALLVQIRQLMKNSLSQ